MDARLGLQERHDDLWGLSATVRRCGYPGDVAVNWTDESNWTVDAREALAELASREGIVSATGHRPTDMGLSYSKEDLEKLARFARDRFATLEPKEIISGVAQGWDTAAAFASLWMKCPLTLAVPFVEQASKWPSDARRRYDYLLERANRVVEICPPGYDPGKLHARNEWMVKAAANGCVAALYSGKSTGGTASCVRYARRMGVRVVNFWDDWTSLLVDSPPGGEV